MHPRFNSRGLWFVVFLNFLFLFLFFVFFQYQIIQIKNDKKVTTTTLSPIIVSTPTPIAVQSLPPIPSSSSPSATPKSTTISASSPTQISYIPITGGTTQSTTWTDIPGTNFNFNIADYAGGTSSAYGTSPYITWDANLRVVNKNDTTYVRLFDKTHSIAVNGSEISISDTYISTDVVSGQLSFWAGNNSYVAQIKSLNGSVAYMDSGRVKITY